MSYQVRVKVCGVTSTADALQAAALGADAVGLNFYPQSPRYVLPEDAAAILRELPPFVEPVGLFVNQPLTEVFAAAAGFTGLRTVQWHGDEPEVSASPAFRFIPAFAVRDRESLARISRYLERCRELGRLPAAVLVDAHVAGLYGGTGQRAPWELLADFRPGVPLILAGGLTPDNVAEAVRVVQPYAVDVASGVESSPGRKDVEEMRRFIGNVRDAG
jgi:phosphoribosylanthranilate isomerase